MSANLKKTDPSRSRGTIALWAIGLGVLAAAGYYATLVHYLLFHSIAEIFSVVVAGAVFMFAWNSRHRFENDFFVVLGITYLFVGILDLLHTLSYTGMGIFPEGRFYANQIWIATRAVEAGAILFAVLRGRKRKSQRYGLCFLVLGTLSAAVVVTVFVTETFPPAYIAGVGQTRFKVIGEYVVAAVLALTFLLVVRDKSRYPGGTRLMILGSLATTIAAELLFTFYVSNYGISNFFGHLFKVISFVLIYLAVVREGLQNPITFMHTELAEREAKLRSEAKRRDLLLTVLAHDLRNPIGGIASITDRPSWTKNPTEVEQTVGLIHETAASAQELLENLLTLLRTQTGSIEAEPAPFAVAELAEAVRWTNASSARAKEVELTSEVPTELIVHADETLIKMVLHNLCTNAVKFTPTGGKVTIGGAQEGSLVHVWVVDTGVGMDRQTLKEITEEGRIRSRPGTNGEKGTGIGLLLCRQLVEANNGSLIVASEKGSGSQVTLRLPGAKAHR